MGKYDEFDEYENYDIVLKKGNNCENNNKIYNNKEEKRNNKKGQMNNCYNSKHIRKMENRLKK